MKGTSLQKDANNVKRWPVPIFAATMLLAGLLLGACSGPAPQAPPTLPASTGGAGGISVVDALGRTIEFPEPPQRIVVAGKSSLTIMDSLYLFASARDRVAGLVVGNQKPGDFLGFVDPTFGQKAVLEMDAGPEQIAPLDPDVVILRSFMEEQLGKPLGQLDIPVVYVDLETPEQYFRDLSTLGQLLDDEVRARDIQAYYSSRLDHLADRLEGLQEAQKPSILILQYTDQGGEVALNVPSATWLQTLEAELAGGVPIWKEAAQGGGWMVVNFEQIAAWDPDTIFVIHYKSDSAQIVDRLQANPRWQALRAVQEGQIYGFAADVFSWDQPDPRWILGVTWLAGKLHPDRLSDLDMMEEIATFFGQMYGLDEETIAEKILPSLKGDIQ